MQALGRGVQGVGTRYTRCHVLDQRPHVRKRQTGRVQHPSSPPAFTPRRYASFLHDTTVVLEPPQHPFTPRYIVRYTDFAKKTSVPDQTGGGQRQQAERVDRAKSDETTSGKERQSSNSYSLDHTGKMVLGLFSAGFAITCVGGDLADAVVPGMIGTLIFMAGKVKAGASLLAWNSHTQSTELDGRV